MSATETEVPAPAGDGPEGLQRLATTVLAVVPALTVALAAVGGASGGLARLFRDRTGTALGAVLLILASFALAAVVARLPAGARRGRRSTAVRGGLLVLSTALLFTGVAWAFSAQIVVMGTGQAPVVTGEVEVSPAGEVLRARVQASGVRSRDRVVVYAFEAVDEKGDQSSGKAPPLYESRTGPDPDGVVDVPVVAPLPASRLRTHPYVFVTAVLGEQARDCDGGALPPSPGVPSRPESTACLTLQKPAAGYPSPAPSPSR